MRSLALGCVLVAGIVPVHGAEPPPDEAREAVLATVQRFFETMATRDVKGAKELLLPEGLFFSVRNLQGKAVVRSSTHREYLERLPRREEDVLERIWEPVVQVHGRIASVWARYDFWRYGAFSHCGVDAFDLVQTDEGWRIAGGIYTVETEACPPSPLGPPPRTAPTR